MPGGGRSDDDDEDDAVETPPMIPHRETPTPPRSTDRRAELLAANDFIRDLAGRVALELATTPEGRAAGLSVEVWPDDGVWLRVRTGHELRIYAVRRGDTIQIRWERNDPQPSGTRTTDGELGPVEALTADHLRTFVSRWLSWRAEQ